MQTLFFIAITFPDTIAEAITAVKQDFHLRFNSGHALKLMPHITLKAPFSIQGAASPAVLDWFEQLPVTHSFHLRLNGFASFNNSKIPVIYIRPESSETLYKLQQQTIHAFQARFPGIPVTANEKNFSPHITVAYRDLTADAYRAAWQEYRERSFFAECLVDNFCLLQHHNKQWNIVARRLLVP